MIAANIPEGTQRPRELAGPTSSDSKRSRQLLIDQVLHEVGDWLVRCVRRTAARYRVEADELFQETLIGLLRSSVTVDLDQRGMRTWLARRVEWSAVELQRQHSRTPSLMDDVEGIDLILEEVSAPSSAQELRGVSVNQRLLQEIGLSHDQAQAVALRASRFDLSLRDVAELVERNYGKTRQDYSRGMRRLEDWIGLTPPETSAYTVYRRSGSITHAAVELKLTVEELRSLLEQANQKIRRALLELDDDPAVRASHERHAQEVAQDKLRVEYLRSTSVGSPAAVKFAIDLRNYGMGVMLDSCRKGRLHERIKELYPQAYLPAVPSGWDFPPVNTLVFLAAHGAIEGFMEEGVFGGGWNPDRGATLRSSFVCKAYGRYINEYRKAYRIAGRLGGELAVEFGNSFELDVVNWLQSVSADPAKEVVDRDLVRRSLMGAGHAKIPEIVYRRAVLNETYREIARAVGMTEGAVGTALARFRDDVKQQIPSQEDVLEDSATFVAPAVVAAVQSVDPLRTLTARELEVLSVLAEGMTNRQISERLFVAEKTVGVHISRIYRKLGVRGRVQATSAFRRSQSKVVDQ